MKDGVNVATRHSPLAIVSPEPGDRAMRRNTRRWWMLITFVLVLATLTAFPFLWQQWVQMRYASAIYALDQAPSNRVAIVLGARVFPSGRLSGMLRDRVETAVALYQADKVDKIIMTGDNSHIDYNEPDAMKAHAVAMGVPADAIQPDYGGRRTYDSCYRANAIFGVEEAVVVTQAFHLPRALFLCEQLGIEAVGVEADRRRYDPRSIAWSEAREIPATLFALVDALRRPPPPVLGEPIPLD